jgi:uncharacterized membrane protein YfcA
MKSLIWFFAEISSVQVNWMFLLVLTTLTVIWLFFGQSISKKISGDTLKPLFGWFVLILGWFIVTQEIISLF